tara:strand:+ start:1 stop:948 length:948 start_codon:yes stop_codon:yes gene_type:complete
MVRGGKPDPEKRPFDEDMQQAMFAKMKKQYPFLEASFVVPNGAIDTMFAAARPAYEPMMWGYGTDRKKAYGNMINKQSYRDDLGVDPSFKGYEIPRTGENISASKVRNALKIDDERTFKKMTPKSIHGFYKPLQTIMQPIKENDNMKNLKSLTDFSINESKFNKKSLMKAMKKDDGMNSDIVSYNESVVNEGNGQTVKEFGDLLALLLDEDSGMDIERAILAMDPKKARVLEKQISTLSKKLFNLTNDGFNLRENNLIVNEEYIELMPELEEALGRMAQDWEQWKNGPLTEPKDIKPAAKELTSYVMNWLKKNIK